MKKAYTILSLLIVFYLANGISSINAISITADEGSHLSYGIRVIKGNPARTDPEKDNSKMPVSVLNALPRAMEQLFSKNLSKNDNGAEDTKYGRYVTLFFSVLTILLVFTWSRQLYGTWAGLFSAFLMACCPNNLANAVLVTTDTYSVFFLLATFYFLWRYCNSGFRRDFLYFVLLLSLSQLAKQSLFHLYVLAPLCMAIFMMATGQPFRWKRFGMNLLFMVTAGLLVINAGFLFYGMNLCLGDYHFMSSLFSGLRECLPAGLPVPFSRSFVEGLDQAKFYDQLGGGLVNSSFGNITVLGHSSTGGAFWYYYFVSILFKTPIAYFLLWAWAGWLLVKKGNRNSFIRRDFFLLAPVLYFLALMSFFYKTQCGIRHLIFIYPLLFIASGIIVRYLRPRFGLPVLALLSVFLVFSVAGYFNNYYAYTNEFIRQKKYACLYVGSSNLNIGQSWNFLAHYLQGHPEVKMAPESPRAGKFVLSVDAYLDIWNTGKYAWLRKLKPADGLFHSFLLFDVQPNDLNP